MRSNTGNRRWEIICRRWKSVARAAFANNTLNCSSCTPLQFQHAPPCFLKHKYKLQVSALEEENEVLRSELNAFEEQRQVIAAVLLLYLP